MAKTNYWIWTNGYLNRVIVLDGWLNVNGVTHQLFYFKDKEGGKCYYINPLAFAKTKAEALKMDISTREYDWGRSS